MPVGNAFEGAYANVIWITFAGSGVESAANAR